MDFQAIILMEHAFNKKVIYFLMDVPVILVFHPRCRIAVKTCCSQVPALREVRPGHWAACSEAQPG